MRHLSRLFWIGVFAAIAAVGAPMMGKPESALPLKDNGRDGSVNTVLEQTLNEPKAAERLTDWMSGLPNGRAILMITPPDNMPAAITADLISYLAWPRPVVISSDMQKTRTLMASAREHFCAVGVCYLQPPPQAKISKTFGPALSFISFEAPQP